MLLIARIVAFSSVAVVYLLLGWLNWSMGLKLALLGATALLAASAWTTRNGYETKAGKCLVLLIGACFFHALGFHAFLRDFFGITPDDEYVVAALFSSDQSEATEFVQQHARQLAKHVFCVLVAFAAFGSLVWWKPAAAKQSGGSPRRRGAWLTAGAFSQVFLLLPLNTTQRKQKPLLYFTIGFAAW